ncbi:glycosyltransferase (type 1) [Pyrobaculum ferrireducens]|uniref:Glycosyltransferase (Type 1) n=2 Tax=Pyrobaculum ferrireducens TaxID=1104324 RepID=G7VID1_9CREN|nr:glycosyltransferase (type 1) [Pyrobaculum ferrireducens]
MKPRLLVLTKLFWPEGSGAELATYIFLKRYLAGVFDVIVVSSTPKPTTDVLKCCRYVTWSALRSGVKPVEWALTTLGIDYIRGLIKWADVVYIPSHTLLPLALIIKRVNPRARVVFHIHNHQLLTYTSVVLSNLGPGLRSDILVELLENRSLARALFTGILHGTKYLYWLALLRTDLVIFVTRKQLDLALSYGLPVGRSAVVYNPPPEVSFTGKELTKDPLLIYVGGDSFIKGFHILLRALPRLIRSGVRLRLFGNYRRVIKLPNVEFVGRVSHDYLMRVHRYAWGLLFPSINEEPLPYAVVESAVSGTVPLVSNAGGAVEVLRGTPAEKFVFKVGDADDMADKVLSLVAEDTKKVFEIGLKTSGVVLKRLEESSRQLPRYILSILD